MRHYGKENGYSHMYDIEIVWYVTKKTEKSLNVWKPVHMILYTNPWWTIKYYTSCLYDDNAFYENSGENKSKRKENTNDSQYGRSGAGFGHEHTTTKNHPWLRTRKEEPNRATGNERKQLNKLRKDAAEKIYDLYAHEYMKSIAYQ